MDLSDVDPKVAGILRKYYKYTYGDSLTWQAIESLRFDGVIGVGQLNVRFVAYKKKPDLTKVVIHFDSGGRLVYGYDGKEAWQYNTEELNSQLVSMPRAEALNFIRDATTGGHLLYPQLKGKRFEFAGTTLVEGDRVYELITTLPDGQLIRSFFDMTSFAELYQITINNVDNTEELSVNSDFRLIEGVRIPFSRTLLVDGQQVHHTRLEKVEVNVGSMPWVFGRASVANWLGKNSVGVLSDSSDLPNTGAGSSFSIESADIWETTSGVVGSAFQIESAGSGEETRASDMDNLKKEPGGAED